MRKTSFTIVTAIAGVMLAGSLSAKPALKDVAYVREGIIAAGMAYEISQRCDSISPRYIRGLNYLNMLKDHARGLGYTNAEIEAYTDDRAEKARLEGIARARLADKGAVTGQGDSFCVVGRAEIAAGSPIGRLLY